MVLEETVLGVTKTRTYTKALATACCRGFFLFSRQAVFCTACSGGQRKKDQSANTLGPAPDKRPQRWFCRTSPKRTGRACGKDGAGQNLCKNRHGGQETAFADCPATTETHGLCKRGAGALSRNLVVEGSIIRVTLSLCGSTRSRAGALLTARLTAGFRVRNACPPIACFVVSPVQILFQDGGNKKPRPYADRGNTYIQEALKPRARINQLAFL